MKTLEEKVALITGGSKGIGLAVAKAMLDKGMKVAITGRNNDALDAAATTLNSQFLQTIVSDVRSLSEEEKAVTKVLKTWGRLDVLIANAGIGHFQSIEDLTPDQWHAVIDTNLTGVFNSVKASLPAIKNKKGYIITIASLAGTNFFAKGTAYNASKFGLVGFTQALMLDVRHSGVNVSTIMPGSVSTHFNNRTPGEADAWKIQPEDIGQIVINLLEMNPRTLPSKVEVRPSQPPKK